MENISRLVTSNDNRFDAVDISTLTDSEKEAVLTLCLDILAERCSPGQLLTSPKMSADLLRVRMASAKNEIFGMILLTNRHAIIDIFDVFQGTIDAASVHPRVILQMVMEHNAAAVIFFHNHPSGDPSPSMADQRLTTKLRDILALVDVRVLDHLVVGGNEVVSFAESGLL